MSESSKKRIREDTNPDPETSPNVPEEQKGQPSARLYDSKESAEDEEKRSAAQKLGKREQGSW